MFLYTDDIQRDYQNLKENNITIIGKPSKEIYGTVLVFAGLYGNLCELIEKNVGPIKYLLNFPHATKVELQFTPLLHNKNMLICI